MFAGVCQILKFFCTTIRDVAAGHRRNGPGLWVGPPLSSVGMHAVAHAFFEPKEPTLPRVGRAPTSVPATTDLLTSGSPWERHDS